MHARASSLPVNRGLTLAYVLSVGLALVVNSWLVTRWGVPPDPLVPIYAMVGLGGLALSVLYLRGIAPAAEPPAPAEPRLRLGSGHARAAEGGAP
jgi:hypothetical protein